MPGPIDLYSRVSVAVLSTLFTRATILVLLRILARARRSALQISDGMLLFTWTITILYFIASVRNEVYLAGVVSRQAKGTTLSKNFETHGMIDVVLFEMAQCITVPLSTMSVTLLLIEIEFDKRRLRVLQTLIIFLVIQAFMTCLVVVFTSSRTPSGHPWTVFHPRTLDLTQAHTCVAKTTLVSIRTSCSIIAEITIFVMALVLVAKLRVNSRQKFGLILSFGLGLITCFTSVLSAYYEREAFVLMRKDFLESAKKFFISHTFGAIEINIGLALAAALPIRAQILRFIQRLCCEITPEQQDSQQLQQTSNPMDAYIAQEILASVSRSDGKSGHVLVTTSCVSCSTETESVDNEIWMGLPSIHEASRGRDSIF